MKHAYISCPMTVSQAILDEVIKLVKEYNVNPKWWPKRSNYSDSDYKRLIESMDAFIVILPNLNWNCQYNHMTSGSRKELSIALKAKVPIYLVYRNMDRGMGIYATEIKTSSDKIITSITGIASTRYNFRDDMAKESNIQKLLSASEKITDRKHKIWLELQEELHKQDYQRSIEKAIFPAWIDTSAIPPIQYGKIIDYFMQTGMFPLNTGIKLGIIPDDRILLFF